MNDWKSIILGSIIALILSLFLAKVVIGGVFAGIIGSLIAGLIIGYYLTSSETEHITITGHLTSSEKDNVAINGAAAGFIGGFIFVLIGVIMTSFMYNTRGDMTILIAGGIPVGIMTGIFYGVICAVGGIIGVSIKRSRLPKENTI